MNRKSATWMKKEDDRILEYLDTEEWATPNLIAREQFKKVSSGHVEERLRMLWYAELVTPIWSDAYELTSLGALYLRGELDVEHQPTPTVERVLRRAD